MNWLFRSICGLAISKYEGNGGSQSWIYVCPETHPYQRMDWEEKTVLENGSTFQPALTHLTKGERISFWTDNPLIFHGLTRHFSHFSFQQYCDPGQIGGGGSFQPTRKNPGGHNGESTLSSAVCPAQGSMLPSPSSTPSYPSAILFLLSTLNYCKYCTSFFKLCLQGPGLSSWRVSYTH